METISINNSIHWSWFLSVKWQWPIISSNGLAYWCIYASTGLDESWDLMPEQMDAWKHIYALIYCWTKVDLLSTG